MYRFKWPVKFSSIKNWTRDKFKRLGATLPRKTNISRKQKLVIISIAIVLGTNTFFWWYRANHQGFDFMKNGESNPPQEWEVDLNEHFLDEEKLKQEYSEEEKTKDTSVAGEKAKEDLTDNEKKESQESPNIDSARDGATTISQKNDNSISPEADMQENQEVQATSLLSTMAMPTLGRVITTFAVDSLVYSKTLEQWNSHHGIDIAADMGAPVKAAMEGTVETIIKNDPKLGVVVILDHGGGIKTLYGNLASDKMVKKDQIIKKGQVLGAVGNTAPFEIEDPPHLHFEVFKDGKHINPQQYLPKLN